MNSYVTLKLSRKLRLKLLKIFAKITSVVLSDLIFHIENSPVAPQNRWSGQKYTSPWSEELKQSFLDCPEPPLIRANGFLFMVKSYIHDPPYINLHLR